jgi:hypothetical protein
LLITTKELNAGIKHHVALPVVGIDRLTAGTPQPSPENPTGNLQRRDRYRNCKHEGGEESYVAQVIGPEQSKHKEQQCSN